MAVTHEKGIARAQGLVESFGSRARQLRAEGKKVVGYLCCYPPVEFLTALDLVPFRIQGSTREPISQADAYLETIMCPFMRSCFDRALKGEYDFLDGLVVPHSCDTVQRIYDIWRFYSPVPFTHFLNVPHMVSPSSFTFFERELELFLRALEGFTGRKITPEALQAAVELHDENRRLIRELYELRKAPRITGTEVLQVMMAITTVPVVEANDLLREVIGDVASRQPLPPRPRVLIYGSELDDTPFIKLVEDTGAYVVMDDICTGSRAHWQMVGNSAPPTRAIARRYLEGINCPRTYRPRAGSHVQDLEDRFGYLKKFVKDYGVQGVIFYIIRYCDTHELDVPDVKEYLEQHVEVPVLPLEDDYNVPATGQLRTRIEAFLEMLPAGS
ncbi:MAG: 2-hydroxyacyl-CoA dehydratase family protein [Dehalococcoidia bacterium]|nr:2-hydroxyacyl-CoA dehydratase family protein [Dehalococcoidia bacterium]